MADISKVKLPDGSVRDIKDPTARSSISGATTASYPLTIARGSWTGQGPFTYTYTNTNLRATHPPIVKCTDDDKTNYYYIKDADATPNIGIVFTASARPSADIHLIVIDLG